MYEYICPPQLQSTNDTEPFVLCKMKSVLSTLLYTFLKYNLSEVHFVPSNCITILIEIIFLKVNAFQIMGNKSLDTERVLSDVQFVVSLPEVLFAALYLMKS